MVDYIKIDRKHLTPNSATILEAMENIDLGGLKFTLVVEDDGRVLGTLSDGDIRRALINGVGVNNLVKEYINQNFIFLLEGQSLENVENLMDEKAISHIPILNHKHMAVALVVRNYHSSFENNDTPVFLLAGGLGRRLRPLTDDYPKPMIEIAGRPIIEHIVSEFARQGFRNIFIAINFKGQLIKEFFESGKKWGVKINYIEEKQMLGTAGSLSLLQNLDFENILVMNGDLHTQVDFKDFLDSHVVDNAYVTICSRAYTHQIPFGVLLLDETKVIGIEEKPLITQMMSAGIYALKKECIEFLEYNTYCDMPELIEKLLSQQLLVTAYETKDNWIDIGRSGDLERARDGFLRKEK